MILLLLVKFLLLVFILIVLLLLQVIMKQTVSVVDAVSIIYLTRVKASIWCIIIIYLICIMTMYCPKHHEGDAGNSNSVIATNVSVIRCVM